MDNSSNPVTANPQSIGGGLESQNNPGIQNTVDDDALRQQQGQLNVVTTGEPASQPQEIFTPNSSPLSLWPIAVYILIIVGVIILAKLLLETVEEDEYEEINDQPVEAILKKKSIKKKSTKKKSAPNQRRKKVSKNKR